jgi:hypothetical protein
MGQYNQTNSNHYNNLELSHDRTHHNLSELLYRFSEIEVIYTARMIIDV